MHLIDRVSSPLDTLAQGGLGSTIFYFISFSFIVEKAGSRVGNYQNVKSVQDISGQLVRRLENRKKENNSRLLLGLGGKSMSIHYFLVLQ